MASIPAFSCSRSDSEEGTTWVRPAGDLDFATAPALEQALESALRSAPVVVLDLSDLTFIDIAGVRVISGMTSAARRMGRRLITLRGPDHVHDIFALTRTENEIDLHDLGDSALSRPPLRRAWPRGPG